MENKKPSFLQQLLPVTGWLPSYKGQWLKWDIVAGVTLASFVLPESMAYATLAGLPAHLGIYCTLFGGLIFALFTTSKHVAVGPTSSISLMVGSTVAILSGSDPEKWIAIAGLAALAVALLCFIAYILRLSSMVNFISDSILIGFKAGAALSIISTQLPKLFGIEGGGSNFFDRIAHLVSLLPNLHWPVFLFGMAALAVMFTGDHFFPGKPFSLGVVFASILLISYSGMSTMGFHITGHIPGGLPTFNRPAILFSDIEGVIELAFACFLMGYIETVSAARTLAMKFNYSIDPHQELLSLGASNLATSFFSGYIVAGGLSQSTVNEKSGAKTPLSLIICSMVLAIILLFFSNLFTNLPEVILSAIVIHAVIGLIKIQELKRIWQLSRMEFTVAIIAVAGVLVFGILEGVVISVILSLILIIRKTANPNVAKLGRDEGSETFSDVQRHPDNIQIPGLLILRIESSIFYFNSENVLQKILSDSEVQQPATRMLVLDLSASPYVDVAGSKMLLQLAGIMNDRGIRLKLVDARANVRDILRKQGMENVIGPIQRQSTIGEIAASFESDHGV